jgi:hypothetical protein
VPAIGTVGNNRAKVEKIRCAGNAKPLIMAATKERTARSGERERETNE